MENVRRLRFVPVGAANRAQAERIAPAPGQEGFIESVRECLAEADALALWRPVCVYDGALLIGFAMYGLFPTPAPGRLWLDRLLIGAAHYMRNDDEAECVVRATLDALNRFCGKLAVRD